jgi:phosphate transport system permease protein
MAQPDRNNDTLDRVRAGLKARYRREARFRFYGLASVMIGLGFLVFFFASIVNDGVSAFRQSQLSLNVEFSETLIDPQGTRNPATLQQANYRQIARSALQAEFPDADNRSQRRDLMRLLSTGAEYQVREMVLNDPSLIGTTRQVWLPADDEVDMFVKTMGDADEMRGKLNEQQIAWITRLKADGKLALKFNTQLFTAGDSRDPELAGIWGATVGSFYMLLVTLVIAFPIGVMAAIYLEEFAPQNRWTDLIEVNINNLAAVPSIVFGLLGLAMFINVAGLPRSAPLVGGLVLSLMTLPIVIIAGRAAIKSVPPSIRTAALGIGASHMQTVFHHVLPLAMPGMLTGAIIGMARALGESAPLLMIGMVAFIVEVPGGPTDPSTALPVQIYLWADSPERAFVERTSAAIIVLLVFLMAMNATAVWLRRRFERRWD